MEANEYVKMDALEADHWWFQAKRRYLAWFVGRYARPSTRPLRLLDIGCGTGAVMEYFQIQGYETEGVDMSPEAVNYTKQKGLTAHVGRAETLAYADQSFDVIIAADVLEHIADTASVLREIRRVLRPGGILVATVPAHQWLFSAHDVALHHVRRYSLPDLRTSIAPEFTVQYLGWIHSAILLPAIVLRLLRRSGRGGSESDVRPAHPVVNTVLRQVYRVELFFLKQAVRLPFGLSLVVVAQKPII